MEGVRVLDRSGKVLFIIGSVGEEVSIGRDRKCGIALAIDANGVSRIHGSLKWSAQDEVTLCDNSSYGTVVNGKLVKGVCQTIRDGSRIFVGDVELVIVFPQHQLGSSSSSQRTSATLNQDLSSKRKGSASGLTESERKRSKLEANDFVCSSRQAQISSFFGKEACNVNHSEDNCITLAEDTPRSQLVDCLQNNRRQSVSFVTDSVGSLSAGSSALLHQKPESSVLPKSKILPSGNVRRKKQCIFDVNMPPPSFRASVIFAEDTQEGRIVSASLKKRSGLELSKANNDSTCIQETSERTMQSMRCSTDLSVAVDNRPKEVASPCPTTFGKQVSALHTQIKPNQNLFRNISSRKTQIFECYPSYVSSSTKKVKELSADDEREGSPIDDLALANLLKLVSSGKRYDDVDDDHGDDVNVGDEKGIEIDRVVAKLGNLVHYADIECRPARDATSAQSRSISTTKCANFKRFRKANQGRFNDSLRTGNIPCIIDGKDDLVDFRQLSHLS